MTLSDSVYGQSNPTIIVVISVAAECLKGVISSLGRPKASARKKNQLMSGSVRVTTVTLGLGKQEERRF